MSYQETSVLIVSMATSRSLLEPWSGVPKQLDPWLERLEEMFILDDVTENEDRKKVASLLAYIGDFGYGLLRDLFSPEKPSSKLYAELKKKIVEHVCPVPKVMVERQKFYHVSQGNSGRAQFMAEMQRAAQYCDFPSSFYDQALRDRFVCGLADNSIRKALLSEEKDMSLNEA